MKIINQHLGLPVICLDSSERVGDVIRFITDQVSGRIVAVAVARRWYLEPAGVLFADCTAFGQNVVLVKSADTLRPLSQMEEVSLHLEAGNEARQRTAITEGGRLLGSVTDEAFDEATGEVTGYRLDILAETGTGRTVYIPRTTFVTSSGSVAILQEDVLDHARASLEDLSTGQDGGQGSGVGSRVVEPEPASPGAWPGAEELEFATPADVTDEVSVPAPAAEPAPVVPPAPAELPASPFSTPTSDLAADLDEALPPAEEFAPILPDAAPDLIPLSEEEMADVAPEEAAAPVGPGTTQTTAPEAAPRIPEMPEPLEGTERVEGHNRVMMALSLGRTAGATLTDDAGNVIVEAGQTITLEAAQAAARAQKLYELWTSAEEPAAEE